jgi:hypothetical protein
MEDFKQYECVSHSLDGKQFNLCHHWRELRTFFGFIHSYRCENCGQTLTKKKFENGNYHIYDKIEHL